MPVSTRSQSVLQSGCKGIDEILDGKHSHTQSVLKENVGLQNQQQHQQQSFEPVLKTSHASVSLFTPRVMTRSQCKPQVVAEEVPMDTDEDDEQARQMLLRCSGKQATENLVVTPPGAGTRSSSVIFSPPSSSKRNISDRPVLTGIDFGCGSGSKTAKCLRPATPEEETPRRRKDSRGRLLRSRCQGEAHDPQEDGPTGRIMVFVRLRPLSRKEKEAGARSCVRVVNKRDIYLTEFALETDYLRLKRLKGRHFAFDAAFQEGTGQQEVYNSSTAELVEAVLQGRNGSVFCYGATGAGKTYTMLGTVNHPGVMVLALKDLFTKLKQKSKEGDYVVRLSYLEVYNESVRDLLSPGRPLVLREDTKQGIVAAGLTQFQAYSAEEVMLLLQRGNQNRTTEPTRINETSSRSHAILQVVAEYKVRMEASTMTRTGKLSLIDLAGSERALATEQSSLRSLEGANINRSLLALSSCIKALVEGQKHIPFRNSKLTQLLKDSLGGTCQTVMIANITPSTLAFGETQNTLHWADRAKEIRTRVSTNEDLQIPESQEDQTKLLLQMQRENQQLRFQFASLQQKYIALQCNSVAATTSEVIQGPAPRNPLASPPPTPIQSETSRPKSPQHTASARSPRNRDEKSLKDLKKVILMMEKDAERMQKEHKKKEEQMAASFAALKREHSSQIKQKDDIIKKLSQQKGEISNGRLMTPPGRCGNVCEKSGDVCKPERMTTKSTPSKIPDKSSIPPPSGGYSLPPNGRPAPEQKMKPTRKPKPSSMTPVAPAAAPPQTPTSQRFYSPAKAEIGSKKRSFWDLGQSNSPSIAERIRCTRSNSTTPSLLLQPGFTRRRQSEE